MSDRPQQHVGFVIPYRELAEYLKLPRDHRVVRVEMNEPRYGAPGIAVIVEGPAGFLTNRGSPACFDPAGLENWRKFADEVREASIKQYGPYEW